MYMTNTTMRWWWWWWWWTKHAFKNVFLMVVPNITKCWLFGKCCAILTVCSSVLLFCGHLLNSIHSYFFYSNIVFYTTVHPWFFRYWFNQIDTKINQHLIIISRVVIFTFRVSNVSYLMTYIVSRTLLNCTAIDYIKRSNRWLIKIDAYVLSSSDLLHTFPGRSPEVHAIY